MRFFLLLALLLSISSAPAMGQVAHLTRNQWIQPAQNGVLEGRLILPTDPDTAEAVADATVALKRRDGEILQAKTDENGRFVIQDVQPGVYALTARADFVFACCALHVLDADLELAQEYPRIVEISAANIDYTTVKTALVRYLPTQVKQHDFSIATVELDELSARVCGENTYRVLQFEDGIKGRLHCPGAVGQQLDDARLTNVFLMQRGLEIARTLTNQEGEFSIKSLPPGNYSLMAIGPYGLGLIGLELVQSSPQTGVPENPQSTSDGKRLTGAPAPGCCQEFSMQVAPVCEVINICEIIEPLVEASCGCGQVADECGCGVVLDDVGLMDGEIGIPIDGEIIADGYGTPLGGGSMGGGGGSYGGGGGGSGGGGFGTIAGLAGIGGIVAAIASNNDDNPTAPITPATPALP